MTNRTLPALCTVLALSGCGLENLFTNVAHQAYERPASRIVGTFTGNDNVKGIDASKFTVLDPAGAAFTSDVLFQATAKGSAYDVRLASSKYKMVRMQLQVGNFAARAIVPSVGEETTISVDLSPRTMTETLIVEARLSAQGKSFGTLSPEAFAGASENIRAAFDVAGPTQTLLRMVERLMKAGDPTINAPDPYFFTVPTYNPDFSVKESALSATWLGLTQMDYTGDDRTDTTTTEFDTLLGQVAQLYRPEGCKDPDRLRLMFTVDFNATALNGNCGAIDRFKWAKDKPGKTMYFVGWVHQESEVQDPAINTLVGASSPNQIQMYDDGTNGDETAGDNVYTVYFDVPRDPAKRLRLGYKYTWGLRGQPWSGSEEWPGNSRIIQVEDLNNDGFVYRRDVFSDEATNKDKSNLNTSGNGVVGWDTDLHACGPEARENKWVKGSACACGAYHTPTSVGPITVAEPAGGCQP
ncbi:MAG: choice-of-anchor X domain-containing protein [Anaeromyxobacter sp.]